VLDRERGQLFARGSEERIVGEQQRARLLAAKAAKAGSKSLSLLASASTSFSPSRFVASSTSCRCNLAAG
jgi:hypothetical protein